jgi:transcription elongation factor SPT6
MAISNGQGDMRRDSVFVICLDTTGRLIDHQRYDDIRHADHKERLRRDITRLKPDIIVVGGFTPATQRLKGDIQICTGETPTRNPEEDSAAPTEVIAPSIFVYDETARLYQNSARGMAEFPDITPTARYCIALARFAQNPLCEYASLGQDVTAVAFHPLQRLVRAFPVVRRFPS